MTHHFVQPMGLRDMRTEVCKRESRWLPFLAILLLASCPLLRAAPQSDSEQGPRVSLGEINGTPGSSIMMPLSLTADAKIPLRSFSVDIEFVSKSLTFQKVARGIAAELANAAVQASLAKQEEDANGLKHVTLRVTASLPEAGPQQGLPDGLLAYLLFDISPDAQPFTIRLTPTAVSANDLSSPPKKVANLAADPGRVVIESQQAVFDRAAPEIACFFFSH